MKKNLTTWKQLVVKSFLPAVFLSGAVLISVAPISCKVTEEGIQLLTGDFSVPHIESTSIADDQTFLLCFNKPVSSIEATVTYQDENEETVSFATQGTLSNENKTACLTFPEKTIIGQSYTICGTVTDCNGNTLSFKLPFTGYNADVPILALSEIRSEHYTSSKTEIAKHKFEFIEIYVIKSGNLAGLELVSAYDGESKKYCFPTINVKAGEYIVVHLRSPGENALDELEDDLTLSTALDSCPTARDLWASNTSTCLGKTDVILLRDCNNNSIIDAVLFAENTGGSWKTSYSTYLADVQKSGVWTDSTGLATNAISSAVVSNGVTSTRTLSRQNIQSLATAYTQTNQMSKDDASQWIIAIATSDKNKNSSGGTPGYTNSTDAYIKK
jgi:hypothetical protein